MARDDLYRAGVHAPHRGKDEQKDARPVRRDMDPKWKKATAYKKENEEENDEEEEEAVIYLQRSTRQKKLDINFTFADQGGRGGGGDRGRGGRGRGEGRGRGGRGRGDGEGRPPYRERREGEDGERRPPREPR